MSSQAALVSIGSLLVVDDSVVQRTHAVTLCRELGVQTIHEAASGAEALELLRTLVAPPDLMILDIEMPMMDGIELIEELRLRQIFIPMIVASSRELALIEAVETMVRNLGMPILTGLRKPLRQETLHDALAGWAVAQRGAPGGVRPEPPPRWVSWSMTCLSAAAQVPIPSFRTSIPVICNGSRSCADRRVRSMAQAAWGD